MVQFKRVEVRLIPTGSTAIKGDLVLNTPNNKLYIMKDRVKNSNYDTLTVEGSSYEEFDKVMIPHNLFILSKIKSTNLNDEGDEIKEGNKVLLANEVVVDVVNWLGHIGYNKDGKFCYFDFCDRKIVAIYGGRTDTMNLPNTSTSFIIKYIYEYNKGVIITKGSVTYDSYIPGIDDSGFGFPTGNEKSIIKVDLKNTITIKKLKEVWSREEHRVNIMHCLSLFAAERGLTPTSKEMKVVNDWSDNWCNENL